MMLADSPLVQSNNELRFWTSRIALCIYSNILLAFFFRQFWVLYGVAFIFTTQIAIVLGKWAAFIGSDPQCSEFTKFMHQNLRVVLDEYDKLTNGRYGAAKLAAGRLAAEVGLKIMMDKLLRAQGNLRSMRDALENQLKEHRKSSSKYQTSQRRLSFATDDSSSSSSLSFRETEA
jgi:hypothetical protein